MLVSSTDYESAYDYDTWFEQLFIVYSLFLKCGDIRQYAGFNGGFSGNKRLLSCKLKWKEKGQKCH